MQTTTNVCQTTVNVCKRLRNIIAKQQGGASHTSSCVSGAFANEIGSICGLEPHDTSHPSFLASQCAVAGMHLCFCCSEPSAACRDMRGECITRSAGTSTFVNEIGSICGLEPHDTSRPSLLASQCAVAGMHLCICCSKLILWCRDMRGIAWSAGTSSLGSGLTIVSVRAT